MAAMSPGVRPQAVAGVSTDLLLWQIDCRVVHPHFALTYAKRGPLALSHSIAHQKLLLAMRKGIIEGNDSHSDTPHSNDYNIYGQPSLNTYSSPAEVFLPAKAYFFADEVVVEIIKLPSPVTASLSLPNRWHIPAHSLAWREGSGWQFSVQTKAASTGPFSPHADASSWEPVDLLEAHSRSSSPNLSSDNPAAGLLNGRSARAEFEHDNDVPLSDAHDLSSDPTVTWSAAYQLLLEPVVSPAPSVSPATLSGHITSCLGGLWSSSSSLSACLLAGRAFLSLRYLLFGARQSGNGQGRRRETTAWPWSSLSSDGAGSFDLASQNSLSGPDENNLGSVSTVFDDRPLCRRGVATLWSTRQSQLPEVTRFLSSDSPSPCHRHPFLRLQAFAESLEESRVSDSPFAPRVAAVTHDQDRGSRDATSCGTHQLGISLQTQRALLLVFDSKEARHVFELLCAALSWRTFGLLESLAARRLQLLNTVLAQSPPETPGSMCNPSSSAPTNDASPQQGFSDDPILAHLTDTMDVVLSAVRADPTGVSLCLPRRSVSRLAAGARRVCHCVSNTSLIIQPRTPPERTVLGRFICWTPFLHAAMFLAHRPLENPVPGVAAVQSAAALRNFWSDRSAELSRTLQSLAASRAFPGTVIDGQHSGGSNRPSCTRQRHASSEVLPTSLSLGGSAAIRRSWPLSSESLLLNRSYDVEPVPEELNAECAVCLQAFMPSDVVARFPVCWHFFHLPCLFRWVAHQELKHRPWCSPQAPLRLVPVAPADRRVHAGLRASVVQSMAVAERIDRRRHRHNLWRRPAANTDLGGGRDIGSAVVTTSLVIKCPVCRADLHLI